MWWIKWKRVLATVFIPSLLTYMKTLSIFSACFFPSVATSCVCCCSPRPIFVSAFDYKFCPDHQCQRCCVVLSPDCWGEELCSALGGESKKLSRTRWLHPRRCCPNSFAVPRGSLAPSGWRPSPTSHGCQLPMGVSQSANPPQSMSAVHPEVVHTYASFAFPQL